jgi:hypothetical protein
MSRRRGLLLGGLALALAAGNCVVASTAVAQRDAAPVPFSIGPPLWSSPATWGLSASRPAALAADTTPPTITITNPVEGEHVAFGAAVTGMFSCDDEPGGSGVATCAAVGPVDTSSAGTHVFTVDATDVAGNPATKSVSFVVDPDTTAPTITITAPIDGQHYAADATIAGTFGCDDGGGSGVDTCVAVTPIDASTGTHAFTVDATDHAGNPASKTVHYTVDAAVDTTPPTITITSPTEGQHVQLNAALGAAFTCDDPGGSGVATCVAVAPVDTSTPGTHAYTVDATDDDGNPATRTVHYVVDADTTAPTITIASPADGQHFASGAAIPATYHCDDTGGSLVATCTATTPIDTGVGTHTFTVDATDNAGNPATRSAVYTVDPPVDATPPTITITSPTEGQHVVLNSALTAEFTCDDPGGSGAATCVAAGPVDTSTAGAHAFTVDATDNAGNPATKTVHYTVDPDTTPPTIAIASPANGQHFAQGATIPGTYSCDDAGGSGLATCAAANAIDLSVGVHVLTVEATDHAGNTATTSATYAVDAKPSGGSTPLPSVPGTQPVLAMVPHVTAPAHASLTALTHGVTLTLSDLKAKSQVEVRVRRGTRTIAVFKTTASAAGKARLKIKLSRKLRKGLKGRTLTLRCTTTAANGRRKVVTKKLKVR